MNVELNSAHLFLRADEVKGKENQLLVWNELTHLLETLAVITGTPTSERAG